MQCVAGLFDRVFCSELKRVLKRPVRSGFQNKFTMAGNLQDLQVAEKTNFRRTPHLFAMLRGHNHCWFGLAQLIADAGFRIENDLREARWRFTVYFSALSSARCSRFFGFSNSRRHRRSISG